MGCEILGVRKGLCGCDTAGSQVTDVDVYSRRRERHNFNENRLRGCKLSHHVGATRTPGNTGRGYTLEDKIAAGGHETLIPFRTFMPKDGRKV